MTQEQKDLLLKDLCGRLPYGVKVQVAPVPSKEYEHITFNAKIVYIDINYIGVLSDWNSVFQQDITEVKPYLFPLESMTEEQKQEYTKVCELDTEMLFKTHIDGTPFPAMYNSQDWLDVNHFDYRGLIPMGMAIDATGKNIY